MIYWIQVAKVNRPALWDFIFIWLGVRLCWLFAVAVVSEAKTPSGVLVLVSLLFWGWCVRRAALSGVTLWPCWCHELWGHRCIPSSCDQPQFCNRTVLGSDPNTCFLLPSPQRDNWTWVFSFPQALGRQSPRRPGLWGGQGAVGVFQNGCLLSQYRKPEGKSVSSLLWDPGVGGVSRWR